MSEENRVQGMEAVKEREPTANKQTTEEKNRESESPKMADEFVPLLSKEKAEDFRSHWQKIQTGFVDDPHNSVEKADDLVERVMNSITETFAKERSSLENQWNQGAEASTEDLRLAIKRYRSFFNRLLTLETSEDR